MTENTTALPPAVQAVLDAPRVGARIRVTRVRKADGETTLIEGLVEKVFPNLKPPSVMLAGGCYTHVEDSSDAYTVTVEEVEPPTPVLPPEPEDRTVVRIVDANGHIVDVLERDDSLAPSQPERHWWRTGMPSAQTWEEVRSRGRIVPLVPVSSADPALVRDLAEALRHVADAYRALIADVREHGTPITSEVFGKRVALLGVDELLARAEATGGGAAS